MTTAQFLEVDNELVINGCTEPTLKE